MSTKPIRLALGLIPAAWLTACGDSPSAGPETRPPSALILISGDEQTGTVGLVLPDPVTLRVEDRNGAPLPGILVNWEVELGHGSVSPNRGVTDQNGQASTSWTLGGVAGQQALRVHVTGVQPAAVRAIGLPGPATTIKVADGDGQWGAEGLALAAPLKVSLSDAHGNAVPEIAVSFTVTAGGGSVLPPIVATDQHGKAMTVWTLGNETGTQAVAAASGEIGTAQFTAILDSSLDAWILSRPRITAAVTWLGLDGTAHPFQDWSIEERERLTQFYDRAQGAAFGILDPPVNQVEGLLSDDSYPYTALSMEDARDLYLAHVAQSVYLQESGKVSWLLEDFSDEALRILLDSRSFFHLPKDDFESKAPGPLYFITGRVVPAPPDVTLRFFEESEILSATPLATIEALLEWSRVNMAHYLYSFQTANVEWHWHYRGIPPASRIMEGTLRSDPRYPVFQSWTAGCHGTNHFFTAVLRAVNIPVDYRTAAGHATPFFMSEGAYLSHGDDPYNSFSRETSLFPAGELLIDSAQWEAWFGSGVLPEERSNNIGRRVLELAIMYLPNYLLRKRCADLDAGRGKEESEVFDIFRRVYTLADLDAENLWARMDGKISALGGCDAVPRR